MTPYSRMYALTAAMANKRKTTDDLREGSASKQATPTRDLPKTIKDLSTGWRTVLPPGFQRKNGPLYTAPTEDSENMIWLHGDPDFVGHYPFNATGHKLVQNPEVIASCKIILFASTSEEVRNSILLDFSNITSLLAAGVEQGPIPNGPRFPKSIPANSVCARKNSECKIAIAERTRYISYLERKIAPTSTLICTVVARIAQRYTQTESRNLLNQCLQQSEWELPQNTCAIVAYIKRCRSEKTTLEETKLQLRKQLNTANKSITTLTQALDESENNALIEDMKTTIIDLKSTVLDFSGQIDALEQTLVTSQNDMASMEATGNQMIEETSQLLSNEKIQNQQLVNLLSTQKIYYETSLDEKIKANVILTHTIQTMKNQPTHIEDAIMSETVANKNKEVLERIQRLQITSKKFQENMQLANAQQSSTDVTMLTPDETFCADDLLEDY